MMNIKKTIVILLILILSLSILSVVFASEDENDNFSIESFEEKEMFLMKFLTLLKME